MAHMPVIGRTLLKTVHLSKRRLFVVFPSDALSLFTFFFFWSHDSAGVEFRASNSFWDDFLPRFETGFLLWAIWLCSVLFLSGSYQPTHNLFISGNDFMETTPWVITGTHLEKRFWVCNPTLLVFLRQNMMHQSHWYSLASECDASSSLRPKSTASDLDFKNIWYTPRWNVQRFSYFLNGNSCIFNYHGFYRLWVINFSVSFV